MATRLEQVLAVVQQQQGLLGHQCLQAALQPQGLYQVIDQVCRIIDGRQVDHPDTVAVMLQEQFGDPQGQGGLADTGRSHQGQAAPDRQLPDQTADQRITPDHRCQPRRQVVPGRVQPLDGHRQRFVFVPDRGNETVAALGQVDDVALAVLAVTQGPAQGSDMHPQVDVLDHRVRPDPGDQFVLADHFASVFEQHLENVQRPPAHAQRPIPGQDQAPAQVKGVVAKMQHRGAV